jgi:hypothetical protein
VLALDTVGTWEASLYGIFDLRIRASSQQTNAQMLQQQPRHCSCNFK